MHSVFDPMFTGTICWNSPARKRRVATDSMASIDKTITSEDCHFRVLTAPGPGAVAVIELTSMLLETANHVLRRITSVRPQPSKSADKSIASMGRIIYGRWNDEDLIVVRTSEKTWEIQCHGGSVAVNRICNDLRRDGAIEKCTSEDSTLSNIQQQVYRAIERRLPFACSRKTAGLIIAQATNSLCRDLTMRNSQDWNSAEAAATRQRLERWQTVADHLTEPWRVVLAGAPNVGKSSLLNAIAGMERSIVYDQPGTTRDVVEVDTMIDGWPFRFVDTAGLHESTGGEIEELGIQLSQIEASQCDILCLVCDERGEFSESIRKLLSGPFPPQTVLIRNKCDLLKKDALDQFLPFESATFAGFAKLNVSAFTGFGLPELLQWIKLAAVPEEPTSDTALPIALPGDQFIVGH